jgi:hypothetical protein
MKGSFMATSSILGGEHAPARRSGTDVDALGPSDTSDSGSDVQAERNRSALPDGATVGPLAISHASTSDAGGTGERASADANSPRFDSDVLPDRVATVPLDALDEADAIDDPDAAEPAELAAEDDNAQDDERA